MTVIAHESVTCQESPHVRNIATVANAPPAPLYSAFTSCSRTENLPFAGENQPGLDNPVINGWQ